MSARLLFATIAALATALAASAAVGQVLTTPSVQVHLGMTDDDLEHQSAGWLASLGGEAIVAAWIDEQSRPRLAQIDPVMLTVVQDVTLVDARVDRLELVEVDGEVVVALAGPNLVATGRLAVDPARRTRLHTVELDLGLDELVRLAVRTDGDDICLHLGTLYEHTWRSMRVVLDESAAIRSEPWTVAEAPSFSRRPTDAMRTYQPAGCSGPPTLPPLDTAAAPQAVQLPVEPPCVQVDGTRFCLVTHDSDWPGRRELSLERQGAAPDGVLSPVPPMLGELPSTSLDAERFATDSRTFDDTLEGWLADWCDDQSLTADPDTCELWSQVDRHAVLPVLAPGAELELSLRGGRVGVAIDDTGTPTFSLLEARPFLCPVDVDASLDRLDGIDRVREPVSELLYDCLDHHLLPDDVDEQDTLRIVMPDDSATMTLTHVRPDDLDEDTDLPEDGGWLVSNVEDHVVAPDAPVLDALIAALGEHLDCDARGDDDWHPGCHVQHGEIVHPIDARAIERGRIEVEIEPWCWHLSVKFVRKRGRWRVARLREAHVECRE